MSFILDALRKSEKRRPEGTVPDLQSDHLSPESAVPRRNPLLFPLLIALLFNAALLLWWMAPWQPQPEHQEVLAPESRPAEVESKASAPNEASKPAAIPRPAGGESPSVPLEVPQPSSAAEDPASPVGQTVIVQEVPQSEPPPFAMADASPGQTSETDSVADAAAPIVSATREEVPASVKMAEDSAFLPGQPAPAPEVLAITDLPPSVKAGLPPFDFSLHYFTADPNQRMIRINGMILREGQLLTEELRLEEITPDGAVFAYRDLRFEVVRY